MNDYTRIRERLKEHKPLIVCLCGSTRFMEHFQETNWALTLRGVIVLSVGVSKHLPADHGGEAMGEECAAMLDELHLRKIDLADEIFVLNVGGYIGESTTKEIRYAWEHGKPIKFLEPDKVRQHGNWPPHVCEGGLPGEINPI